MLNNSSRGRDIDGKGCRMSFVVRPGREGESDGGKRGGEEMAYSAIFRRHVGRRVYISELCISLKPPFSNAHMKNNDPLNDELLGTVQS